ncbi:Co-activator of prophage gene expression IbrB [Klebsiella pneumoniae]|uniref:Co-activator of prophage gene expression IbrB n=1 Tax=Klebsiella pneumoniae TaxID=573 RepID=A0A377VS59_KLEPN|nr:Co-activator of prophage gene expression IbrB [Klebsiella pneumoniae]
MRSALLQQEPVDCVLWVKADEVVANDYNPNVMAPGEKRLLKQSLEKDGFTQPVVVSEDKSHYLVVDGFIVSYWAGNQIQGNA